MRLRLAVLAVASAVCVTSPTRANPTTWQPPALPIPQLSQLPGVGQWLGAVQACPPVEIAPGIFVPIPCAAALPRPPDDAQTVELPVPLFVPAAVDLRASGLDGPVKDQKQTGVCFAFALSSVLESSLRRQGRSDVLSPLHVVAADTWSDLWRAAPKEAVASEATWPYDPVKACRFLDRGDSCERTYGVSVDSWRSDPALVAERDRAARSGVAWVGQARKLKNNPVAQIVASLAGGREVYVDVDIDGVAWGHRGVKGGVLPEYQRADRGGHAVVVVGYRTVGATRQFLLHNSWGPGWGEGGYAWMSEHGLSTHLLDAMIVDARPEGTAAAPPPPVAAPSRPAPGCGPGTAWDLGTGRCEAVCPSGLAPLMGRCWLG